MGFTIETGISALTVFLQGLVSFFSPCVLPLVPFYISYLAGGAKSRDENGVPHYKRGRVLLNTAFFVTGISFAFFLLGLGFTAAGQFFAGHRVLFARIGGALVILFGLYQLGVFQSKLLSHHVSLPFSLDKAAMTPVVALVLGFTFSFSWTPCVGPALAGVLLLATSAGSSAAGFALIGLYTLGFVIPFLAVGLFTGTLLDLFKKYQKAVQYTVKAGGVLLILMGVMMITGWMNGVASYLNSISAPPQPAPQSAGDPAAPTSSATGGAAPEAADSEPESERRMAPPDFTLTDQFGQPHTLSGYQGKVVFLNFWTTWCPYCRTEMPDFQALYEKYGKNTENVAILGIANPKTEENQRNADVPIPELTRFLEDGGYTYPVVMDTTGEFFYAYRIMAYPTTYVIDPNGEVAGYVPGPLTAENMETIIEQTLAGQ